MSDYYLPWTTGKTLDHYLLSAGNQRYRFDTHVFEAFNASNWAHYGDNTGITEQAGSGDYFGTLPTTGISAATYTVTIRERQGGSPAITDPVISGPQEFTYDGAAWTEASPPVDVDESAIATAVAAVVAPLVWTYPTRTMTDGSIRVATPHQVGTIELIRGTSYLNSSSNALTFTKGAEFAWPSDLFSASSPSWVVTLYLRPTQRTSADEPDAASLNVTGTIVSATVVRFDLTTTNTAALTVGTYDYTVIATRATGTPQERLLESGVAQVVDDIATAP